MYFPMRWSKPISLPIGGLLLKERICSLGEQILTFKSNSQFLSDTASTIKLKNKNDFFMENCKMSGKNQGIVREF